MEKDVNIIIRDRQGKDHEISAPADMSMNLMEVCKVNELAVEGICGGMAAFTDAMNFNLRVRGFGGGSNGA